MCIRIVSMGWCISKREVLSWSLNAVCPKNIYLVEDQYKFLSATLISGIPLNMAQVHDAYKEIMGQYHGNIETKDWGKYLDTYQFNLPHVQFVKLKKGKM